MFNYGNANEAQKEAISATDGLVLITAGPGTGKTFTLVKRAVYLIQECGIKPEQIMMATFTEKAAKELITRITNELAERNVSVNVNEMYIGTFHSLCLRIIKENLEFTRLKRNYRLLDTFDQKYLVFRNFHKFKNIEGIDELLSKGGSWKRSDEICTYIKPDMVKMRERLEHYRRQLQIYAYLIEQRTGQKVSKMHLYYTGEENGNPMITYPYTRTAIEGTVAAFDDTVHKILRKDFKHRCDDAKTCKNCDFRYYCNK